MDELAWLKGHLSPRYEVVREIGRGGMATVYLARETRFDRDVAIKVLQPGGASPSASDRFLREIRVTAGFSHPHILPLLDAGFIDGVPYYVMPYVEGESLSARLAREGPLPLSDVVRLTLQIADALDLAHRNGVIHRDVKPANILLEEGHAVVADFGLVRALDGDDVGLTGAGLALGTPTYMSPEAATGDAPTDARSDVYSLGCVVYEMLAGEPPFSANSAQALTAKKLHLPVPPVSTYRELPLSVDRILGKALARSPVDRYRTAGELGKALEQAARALDEPATSWRRSATVAAVSVAAAAAVGLLAWWMWAPRPPALDADKVVVFPLEDGAGGTDDGLLVAQLIQGVLEHAGSLKLIDGRSRLDPGQRADITTLGPEAERDVALGQGARYYIAGRLIPRGDSLHVFLRVHDAGGDSIIAQTTGVGMAGRPVEAGFEALTRLLPAWFDPGREVDLSPVWDRDPGAVVSWIEGEREYRLGRFIQARELFRRAVEADSLFAFAALKGAQAAGWLEDAAEAESFVGLAMKRIDLLPPKHAMLARGLSAYWMGDADSSVGALRAALELDPEWAEAWMALGETYLHLLPSGATGERASREAFERAWSLDPDFNPPLIHLAEFALRRGDLDVGGRLVLLLSRARPNEKVTAHLGLMRDCVAGQVTRRRWDEEASADPGVALSAAKRLSEGGGQLACAEGGFRALWEGETVPDAYRWAGVLGLQAVYLASGRFEEARAVLKEAHGWVGGAVGPYLVLAALAGAPFQEEAGRYADDITERYGQRLVGVSDRTRWVLAAWRWSLQDTVGTRAALDRSVPAADGGTARGELFARVLAARDRETFGRVDDALASLAALTPLAPQYDLMWEPLEALPLERLTRARLLLQQGRASEALAVASEFDHPAPLVNLVFLPASLRIREQAALAMDSVALARAFSDRLEALKSAPAARTGTP